MTITELQKDEVKNLIKQGRKIEAVKYLCDNFGLSLKHAKNLADHIAYEVQDDVIKSFTGNTLDSRVLKGKGLNVARLVGGIFAFIGFTFLSISAIVYVNDSDFIDKAVKVKGVVVNYPSKPLFEYEYQGQIYNFQATITSNPPSYYIGEEVELFVNPNHPQEALVDNFSERWSLITIFGGIGLLFFGLGTGTFFLFRKR